MSADRPEASRPRLDPVDFDPFAGERIGVLPLTPRRRSDRRQMGSEAGGI